MDRMPMGWMFKVVPALILIGWLMIFAYWGFVAWGAFRLTSAVSEHGLKSVVEDIWLGEDEDQ